MRRKKIEYRWEMSKAFSNVCDHDQSEQFAEFLRVAQRAQKNLKSNHKSDYLKYTKYFFE